MTNPSVVVGVDGSDASLGAFAHGAWEASRRGLPLRLVFCYDIPPSFGVLGAGAEPLLGDEPPAGVAELLASLAEQAGAAYPDLAVDTAVIAGGPGATLVEESRSAALVVVGSRGRGGFSGLLLGAVGTQLSAHAAGPVIVIRPPETVGELGTPPGPAPVVVGIDGVPDSESAVAFAFDEAAARGAPVVVLYAWWMLPVSQLGTAGNPFAGPPLGEVDLAAAEQEARRMLAEATAGLRDRYPGVPVTLVPAHAMNPVATLLDESQQAGLLVVSRHGGNALTRLLFSSVGDVAVREAACPVAVVPEASVSP